jgi:hypothetical protein
MVYNVFGVMDNVEILHVMIMIEILTTINNVKILINNVQLVVKDVYY